MADTILSEVTLSELSQLKLNRKHKPIEQHYGLLLRGERLSQKMPIKELSDRLKEKGLHKSFGTIYRWELNVFDPSIDVINTWASCLGLKMSVFVDCSDRRLVKGTWRDKLKVLRKDLNINRGEVCKQIGIMFWTLSQWEQGKKSPSESELKDWAVALGATAQLVFERV